MNEPINRYIDASVLKPEMSRDEAVESLRDCIALNPRTICVRPCDISIGKELCAGTDTELCVVLAFPHGQHLSASKADEARRYIDAGVDEIDMVTNIGWIRSHDWDAVTADIRAVTDVTGPAGVTLKTILESGFLTLDEVAKATVCAIEAGAQFVKTSTGFGGGGATEEAVRTMLDTAAGRIKVKPSGGIRDRARAELFIAMGVHRLGVGFGSFRAIIEGAGEADGSY